MPDTFVCVPVHYVFSTKHRQPLLTDNIRERVWAYMGGIARENRMKALCIGGVEDHVHLLISMPTTVTFAQAMQLIKGGSSKWIHDTFPGMGGFAWQESYGAFAVDDTSLDRVIAYIQNQAEHHRSVGFKDEYVAYLKAFRIPYDERYLWD